MQDCNKRCFFAWLLFGEKERLRETKRGKASQRKHGSSSLLIVSILFFDSWVVSLVHLQSFLSIIAWVNFGFTLAEIVTEL